MAASQRVEALKQHKEALVARKRHNSVRAMIEKEKLGQALASLDRSAAFRVQRAA